MKIRETFFAITTSNDMHGNFTCTPELFPTREEADKERIRQGLTSAFIIETDGRAKAQVLNGKEIS